MALALVILAALAATPVAADPVSIGTVLIAAATTGLAGTATSAALSFAITVAGSLASLALNLAFGPKAPQQPDLVRDLARPQSLPPRRFVYGRTKAVGSPAPWITEGAILYGCLLLNSRRSAGGEVTIAIDKQPVTLGAGLFDFDGPGAQATDDVFGGYATFWLGRGDQVAPPVAITDETAIFETTDAWRGQTVLWCRLDAGPNSSRTDRWRRVPPEIEVVADWSLIYDPREAGQDPDDETTWRFSRNRALIVLDALRRNPSRPYPLDQIDVAAFMRAADSDEELVPRRAGDPEPRYCADGLVAWNGGEAQALIDPIAQAGASGLVRVGGRIALAEGVYSAPTMTIDDFIGGELTYESLRPGRDFATVWTTRYVAPDRDYEMADLAPYEIAGVEANRVEGGVELPFVTSPTQAMRVQKITALRQSRQRTISGDLPPAFYDLATSASASVALPAPLAAMNGVYEVSSIAPALDLAGDGVALRCPTSLIETGPEIYAWNPSEDEQDIEEGVAVTLARARPAPPTDLAVTSTTATAFDTGGGAIPRVLATWTPTLSARAAGYEVQHRVDGGEWEPTATVDIDLRDGDGDVYAYVSPATAGGSYEVRVRAVAQGSVSDWVAAGPVTASGPAVTLAAPDNGSATGGAGQIAISFDAPNDAGFSGIEFYGSATDDSAAASRIAGPIYGPANAAYGFTETGLGAGVTRYYFARALDAFGAPSAFSASVTATTDP